MIFLVKILQNIHLQNNVKKKKSASGRWNKKDIFEYDQQKWRTCVGKFIAVYEEYYVK